MGSDDTTCHEKAKVLDGRISEAESEVGNLNERIEEQGDELEKQAEMICKLNSRIDKQRKQIDSHSERIDRNSNSVLDRPDSVKQSTMIGIVFIIGIFIPIYGSMLPFQGPIWDVFSVMLVGASGTILVEWVINSEKFKSL